MDPTILAVSVLLYASGILMLVGVAMLARDLSSGARRKNYVLGLGTLIYLLALAGAWLGEESIRPVGGSLEGFFPFVGLITAWVGWFALFCVVGTTMLRRVLSSESGRVSKLRRAIYWLSGLILITASWIELWSSWYPWGMFLGDIHFWLNTVVHLTLLLFLITGWRMIYSVLTTGKVPDEFKVDG